MEREEAEAQILSGESPPPGVRCLLRRPLRRRRDFPLGALLAVAALCSERSAERELTELAIEGPCAWGFESAPLRRRPRRRFRFWPASVFSTRGCGSFGALAAGRFPGGADRLATCGFNSV